MKKNKVIKLLVTIVGTAIFSAVVAIISFLPIRTLGLEITLSMVPVAVGAICFGPAAGAILGGVFGLVSFLQCLGWSPFGAALLAIDPLYTFLVCVPTRILAGWLTGLIFKLFNRSKKGWVRETGFPVASFAAALLNTVLFMSTLVLCFYNTDFIQGFVTQLGALNPFLFVVLFVGINGVVELIAGFILAAPASRAVTAALKRMVK